MIWTRRKSLIIFVDLLILGTALTGLYRQGLYPRFPAELTDDSAGLVVAASEAPELLPVGAVITMLDGHPISTGTDLFFYLDRKIAGDSVPLSAQLDDRLIEVSVPLAHFHSLLGRLSTALVIMLFWATALFVYIHSSRRDSAHYFHWCMLGFVLVMGIGREQPISGWPLPAVFILRWMFYLGYLLLAANLLSFLRVFPSKTTVVPRWLERGIYLASLALILVFGWQQYAIVFHESLPMFEIWSRSLALFYGFLFIVFVAGLAIFIRRYIRFSDRGEQKQLRWIVWGIGLAEVPYLFLRTLPFIITGNQLISVDVANILNAFIPLTFGIAIHRENLLDIDIVINRSVVYGILTGGIVALYVGLLGMMGGLLGTITQGANIIIIAILTVMVGLFFYPLKQWLQLLVDKTFFRLKYNFQQALEKTTSQVAHSSTIKQLGRQLVETLVQYLQVEGAVLVVEPPGHHRRKVTHGNISLPTGQYDLLLDAARSRGHPHQGRTVRPETPVIAANDRISELPQIKFLLPLYSETDKVWGAVGCSGKKSRQEFYPEEVEFAVAVVEVISVALGRLVLQKEVLAKEMETEQLQLEKRELELLQEMRADLSSMIVHDLRNPLTSMLFGLQLVQLSSRDKLDEKALSNLAKVESGGKELLEMINDLLEIHKMESGELTLAVQLIEVQELLKAAVEALALMAQEKNIEIQISIEPNCPPVNVDRQRIVRVMVNLLANAIKFSTPGTKVALEGGQAEGKWISLKVIDQGPGIAVDQLDKIFDKFVQLDSRRKGQRSSTGLGLTFCKLAVEKHGGRIWAESTPGKGTTIHVMLTAQFPPGPPPTPQG